ncbi:MAG: ABC transporter permease, partial [Thermoplasmata archaeon]|nr:ABC transporter permease [Thermoplasmata archaeon]
MMGIGLKAIYSVAKKEFADNVRNRWIVALTVIFAILTLLASYVTGGGSVLGGMEETVIGLLSIAAIFIPLIAVMLGYASIAGECENGSMGILLSYPIRRGEVLVGKLIGLGSVIVVSTVIGFGAAGILIAATVGAESGVAYLSFIGLTILSGFLYLSMAVLFSTIAKSRARALGMGVVLVFWSMIYGMII